MRKPRIPAEFLARQNRLQLALWDAVDLLLKIQSGKGEWTPTEANRIRELRALAGR